MAALLQRFLHGLMYLVVLPGMIVILSVYSVIGIFMFVFIGIKAIVLFFTGRNIFGELPEDVRARYILEERERALKNPPLEQPIEPAAPLSNETTAQPVQPQQPVNPQPVQPQQPVNPAAGYPPYPGYPYPPYPGYPYPPYPGYPYPPQQPNNNPTNNNPTPVEEENPSHDGDIVQEPDEVKDEEPLTKARYDGGDE